MSKRGLLIMQEDWKASYDVIVLGFGGAGATAARFAADHGAKVLVVDAAPYGHEGGNTRYSAQLIGTGKDYQQLEKYYKSLTYPMHLPADMVKTFVKGMVHNYDYVKKYLGVDKPVSFMKEFKLPMAAKAAACQEYPNLPGHETYDYTLVHNAWFDAALWKTLRQKVLDRKDKIDIWLNSRAEHLDQDPKSKAIKGAIIRREHQDIAVFAKKGVVLTVGGFENNQEMIQSYLGAPKLSPLGTIYNRGDGIKMAAEVGAKMWHMWNYESLGFLHGLSWDTKAERSILYLGNQLINHGSIFVVTDDGRRYFNETESNRHGHLFDHGTWRVPRTHQHTYLVFDEKQYKAIKKQGIGVDHLDERLVKADTLKELAAKMQVNAANFEQTVSDFNHFAKNGRDYQFGRDPKSMTAFSENGPYYAAKLIYNILNTQGGPERNAQAQIIDQNNKPIPHLYGAGELGGICANQYQGGGNLAECLIFGKIAGENIAQESSLDTQASTKLNGINDIINQEKATVKVGNHQYLGSSNKGIGGKVTVRVTYQNKKIEKVEIVEEHESADVSKKALQVMPQEIVKANSTDVDVVSGASSTSRAIKDAVKDALKKAQK